MSAKISLLNPSGEEIATETIAEGETKSVGGIRVTVFAVGITLAGCEYITNNYYSQDATQEPDDAGEPEITDASGEVSIPEASDSEAEAPNMCETAPRSERCDIRTETRSRCVAGENIAVENNGYLFVPTGISEDGVSMRVLDSLNSCRQMGDDSTLQIGEIVILSLNGETFTAIAPTIAYSDSPPWAILDIEKSVAGPVCAEEMDRCTERSIDRATCDTYEGKGVPFDNLLFIPARIYMESSVPAAEMIVQDKYRECEVVGTAAILQGEEGIITVGTQPYRVKLDEAIVSDPSMGLSSARLVIKRGAGPDPAVCPDVTGTCEDFPHGNWLCMVYEGKAADLEGGRLMTVRRIWEEGGVKKVTLEMQDLHADCAVVYTFTLDEHTDTGSWPFEFRGREYGIHVYYLNTEGATKMAGLIVYPRTCDDERPADFCTSPSPTSVECITRDSAAVEFDGIHFFINPLEDSTIGPFAEVVAEDMSDSCHREFGRVLINVPGYSYVFAGEYSYKITVSTADLGSGELSITIERGAPTICDGSERSEYLDVAGAPPLVSADGVLTVSLTDITRDVPPRASLLVTDTVSGDVVRRVPLPAGGTAIVTYRGVNYIILVHDVSSGVMLIDKWAYASIATCE
jgi:hypothetical protein